MTAAMGDLNGKIIRVTCVQSHVNIIMHNNNILIPDSGLDVGPIATDEDTVVDRVVTVVVVVVVVGC